MLGRTILAMTMAGGLPSSPNFTRVRAGDGTAAAPSISFAADTDTGIYRYAANSIGFATGGANRFFMSGSQFGGVTGQNIDMPAAGSIALVASGTNQNITLTPSGSGVVTLNASVQIGAGFSSAGYTWNDAVGYGMYISGAALQLRAAGGTSIHIFSNQRVAVGNTTDNGALLQVGTDTSNAAGGMVFGANTQLYRSGEGLNLRDNTLGNVGMRFLNNSGGACRVQMDNTYQLTLNSESGSVVLKSSGTTALTLDSSQRTILSGALRLNNAYVAGAVVGTGYVTIQDSTGTTYRVPVLV